MSQIRNSSNLELNEDVFGTNMEGLVTEVRNFVTGTKATHKEIHLVSHVDLHEYF